MIRPGSRERSLRTLLLAAGDFAIAWAALAVAVVVRRNVPLPFTRSLLPPDHFPADAPIVAVFGGAFVIALGLAGFYRTRILPRARPVMLVALTIQVALVAIASNVLELPVPRTILLAVPLLEAILFPLWRSLPRTLWPVRRRNTILVGGPAEIVAALPLLEGDPRIRVGGYAGERPADVNAPWLGPLDDAGVRATLRDAEVVICVSADASPASRLALLRIRGPRGYLLLASSTDALLVTSVLGWMGDEPLIEVMIRCGFGIQAAVKRFLDVAGAAVLMAVSAPLSIAVTLAVMLDGRPVFLRQLRVGQGGVPFAMWKFRTMRDGEATRTGRFLRRYRLDELPQLVNVITGDMSLVGPRPERPEIVAEILRDVPDFDLRCLVRPGIAGLAQILAEYDSRPAVKLRYDLTYMCSWSLWLDVQLLFGSVAAALSGTGK